MSKTLSELLKANTPTPGNPSTAEKSKNLPSKASAQKKKPLPPKDVMMDSIENEDAYESSNSDKKPLPPK